ncbi:MAG TPA: signal peptidase II [Candidatus Competibacteraceae bacterium]|nr:lipoprotein signal peptidase [Candidatus Competibacteraceae bacterium]MCP5134453.1 lipoprotein signal peptidase [Gammaproteobacteria bacterium]HPF59347.1 signal peptidase II [Candidatus Competibacteraceae bacterium]HRY19176.1 signal peptidase II [Candidatus Competibacteraceae bacterium]
MLKSWIWLSGLVIVLDQVTKYLAETLLVMHQPVAVMPSFNLMLTYNTGAAFSFLAQAGGWQRWFFLGLGSLVSIGLVIWLTRLKSQEKWLAAALALILGGAVGNLIDRAWLGQVIDFIQLYYDRWYWPAFNIADSAIFAGAALLVVESLWAKSVHSEQSG